MPKFSVCIPAYNRAALLRPLLDSVASQGFDDVEIVICEDGSPERAAIRDTVAAFRAEGSTPVTYVENDRNLGYDGNLRRLIEVASGEYCVFMGNDDLMARGALQALADLVGRHRDVGVIIRSYATFRDDPQQTEQTFRYFPDERLFPAGAASVVTAFRRCVVISGLVLRRADALRAATAEFDGTLLYQVHLAGRILARAAGVYTPAILALYRLGGVPDFGNAESERGRFVPKEQTPESSVAFMEGMLRVAKRLEQTEGLPVFDAIRHDLSRYSYPFLSIQAHRPAKAFIRYVRALSALGLDASPLFKLYVAGLLVLGPRRMDGTIAWLKRRLGRAPALGNLYQGERV